MGPAWSAADPDASLARMRGSPEEKTMPATDIRAYLTRLHLERFEARLAGLDGCELYMEDLEDEIADCHHAFVLAAVTEIAILRAELAARQVG